MKKEGLQAKKTFSTLFIVFVILLMVMPFVSTFNDIMTRLVIHFQWYTALQDIIVPFEARVVTGFLKLFHLDIVASTTGISIMRDGAWQKILIIWNCVGWQSLIILFITFATGFQGNFTKQSMIETIIIGTLGIFVINIVRITLVILLFKFFGYFAAVVFHDYMANLFVMAFLFFFWWFSYAYVLERKGES